MKFQALAFVTLLVAGAVAAPGNQPPPPPPPPKCQKFDYVPPMCPYCPYNPNHPRALDDLVERDESTEFDERDEDIDPRDATEILERGYPPPPPVCKKPCPYDKKVCKEYDHKTYYYGYGEKYVQCGKYSYKVVIKIENCGDGQCLNVYYNDEGNNKRHYMGCYNNGPQNDSPDQLNYNSYCLGNKCSVPVKNLPGYPNICGKTIWIGIDSSGCYKNNKYGNGQKKYSTYVPVQIQCKYQKVCKEYCCCP
ncbi:Fc.00g023670.m01.CDS01 [Cosmosporella sp. VM-42]